MKPSWLVLSAAALLGACSDDRVPGPTGTDTPPPPVRSWTLAGTVRDENGHEVAGATVEIMEGQSRGRSTTSSASGTFDFQGVYGIVTLSASMDGYELYVERLNVTTDVSLDVRLFKYFEADSIRLGETIRASVSVYARPCDAIGWDAKAPCKAFRFTPASTGSLTIVISWSGGPELDATIVTRQGEYVATSDPDGPEQVRMVAKVVADRTYEIRVNSYYSSQTFNLRADFMSAALSGR